MQRLEVSGAVRLRHQKINLNSLHLCWSCKTLLTFHISLTFFFLIVSSQVQWKNESWLVAFTITEVLCESMPVVRRCRRKHGKGTLKNSIFLIWNKKGWIFIYPTWCVIMLKRVNTSVCWRMKDQFAVTCYFISLLICSTCFGH